MPNIRDNNPNIPQHSNPKNIGSNKPICVKKVTYRDTLYWQISFEPAIHIIERIQQIDGARWSVQKESWMLPGTNRSWRLFIQYFSTSEYFLEESNTSDNPVKTISSCKLYVTFHTGNNKLLEINITYFTKEDLEKLKRVSGRFYHMDDKIWTVPANRKSIQHLKYLFDSSLEISAAVKELFDFNSTISTSPSPHSQSKKVQKISSDYCGPFKDDLTLLEEQLVLSRYSHHTIKGYKFFFTDFLRFCKEKSPSEMSEAEIKQYFLNRIRQKNWSESSQNSAVNAIKYYYEKVLDRPRTFYDLPRPKKSKKLPNVMSATEVHRLFSVVKNIKHRVILKTVYSGGLRVSEVVALRREDINIEQRAIFIKGGKGKKDRHVILSEVLVQELQEYYAVYTPKFWLFEGQTGGRYSIRSVQNIFQRAKMQSRVNPYATVHSLRHSFATHMLENGTDLRYIQGLLGHASPKTTEIYTHITNHHMAKLRSPLDFLGAD